MSKPKRQTTHRLSIRTFDSPDVGGSLAAARPDHDTDVYYYVQMAIGFEDEPGTNLFGVVVATPEALRARETRGSIISDRALLVVREFDWDTIRKHLINIVERCRSDSWDDAVAYLSRYFRWEYEDYR